MCSGCSGDFEDDGGWEQNENHTADCDPESFWSYLRERKRLWREQPDWAVGGSPDSPDVEDYEILVSAERIVERRTIRAKCFVSNEKAEGVAAPRGKSLSEHEQSCSVSAKDYRTLNVLQQIDDYEDCCACKWLSSRYLAAIAFAGLLLWLAVR
jgi:hypothetical protein